MTIDLEPKDLQQVISEMKCSSTSDPTEQQLKQLEREKEQRLALLGKRKLKTDDKYLAGRGAQTDGARGLRFVMVPLIAHWVEQHLEHCNRRGRAGTAIQELNKLIAWTDIMTMSHIAFSVVLDSLGRGYSIKTKITVVKAKIGEQIEHQALISYMEAANPAYFKKLESFYLNDPVRRYDKKITAMKHAHNKSEDMDWKYMHQDDLVRVGSLFLQAIFSVQFDAKTKEGLFQRVQPGWDDPLLKKPTKKAHRRAYYLGYTKTGLKYRDKLQEAADLDAMLPLPMICEPLDWTPTQRGGYLSHVSGKASRLIHNNRGSEASPAVYDAINRLQKIPYRINKYILDLQEHYLQKTWEIGSFRSFEKDSWKQEHFPIVDSDWLDTLDKKSKEYKAEMKKLHKAYHEQRLDEDRAEPPRRIWGHAKDLKDQVFYFPWFIDTRGRLYPAVNGLSSQGPDYGKALLQHAYGAPLTEDSRRDLLISIATAGAFKDEHGIGMDKRDYFERMRWAENFTATEEFVAMVNDPISYPFWHDADEPWIFLALCREFKAIFIDQTQDRVYIFFGRDQSCSGVQILSSIIQDEKAAHFTNVLITDEPQDLYGEVAKEARKLMSDKTWLQEQMKNREQQRIKLNKERTSDYQIEERWTFDVSPSVHDRKVNKTQSMVCGYGATLRTRYNNIKKQLMKKQAAREIPEIHPSDINIVCKAGTDGMEQAFPAYMELNKWFREFAKAVLKAGKEHVTWVSPTGMRVVQEYREAEFYSVQTYAASGAHYSLNNLCTAESTLLDNGKGQPKLSKNASAIAANWTHSLDASIMVLGVNSTPEDVVCTTVHDCCYTLSGYFGQVVPNFRQAMYDIVTQPLLQQLVEENGVPEFPLPPIGSIDLEQIKESPYLFS